MGAWTRAELADLRRRTEVLSAQVRAVQHGHPDVVAVPVPVVAAELAAEQAAYAAGAKAGMEQQHVYDVRHARELGG